MAAHRQGVILAALMIGALAASAAANPPVGEFAFTLAADARVSVAVYDGKGRLVRELLRAEPFKAGQHVLKWDGLDGDGRPAAPGEYEWRLLETPGFTARYVTALGVNPSSQPEANPHLHWVGNHAGAGTVAADDTGTYVGAQMSEGLLALKQSHDGARRLWNQWQFYDGGRLTRLAAGGGAVYLLQPDGKLRRLDAATGKLKAISDVRWDGEVPTDVAVVGAAPALAYPKKGAVRTLDPDTGKPVRTIQGLPGARKVAARGNGELVVEAGGAVYAIGGDGAPAKKLDGLKDCSGGIDVDPTTGDLFVAERDGKHERVLRFDKEYRRTAAYGGKVRPFGQYDPTLFCGISDLAADGKGGFYITEPSGAPRRTAHFDVKTGKLLREWYGAQSFYVDAATDPADPRDVWGCAEEGTIIQYRLNYDTGKWAVVACYRTGLLGDRLFPFTGPWHPYRRDGRLYLRHGQAPAVLRIDEAAGEAAPVAIACVAFNGQRNGLWQFGGTGKGGFPKPFVAAAEKAGFADPAKAPQYFYWGDRNGNGVIDPDEFAFFTKRPNFNVIAGCSANAELDYVFAASPYSGGPIAYTRMDRVDWAGPKQDVPVWKWDAVYDVGQLPPGLREAPSIRGLHLDKAGNVYGTVQGGLMIKEHGQYEGGAWPYMGIKRARLAKWDKDGNLLFAVSRHSKDPGEANTGRLYFPMRVVPGPKGTVIVGEQVIQPAVAWTEDGLYAGSFFDRRADDKLPDGLYRTHSDDMQGCHVAILPDGRVFWFQSVQGMVLVYEVTGWDQMKRQSGKIAPPPDVRAATGKGTGLAAVYYKDADGKAEAFRAIEAPLYFDPFGPPPHKSMPKPPYKITWKGQLEAPLTDDYRFDALLGADETLVVRVGDRLAFERKGGKTTRSPIPLQAGTKSPIAVEYVNAAGPAELRLLWSARNLDRQRIPSSLLYAD